MMTSNPLRILSIFGTRPEAVKMAPIVRVLQNTPVVESRVVVTAQHREMLDQVLDLFKITPDIDLNLMKADQSLAELTASIFTNLDPVLKTMKPDWILIQGDTTTVMAASLLAYYQRIRVGHVEAGLRTGDKWQPFPEEINRRIAGVVADLHFAPTEWSRENLLKENIPSDRIIVTGNPVIDALHFAASQPADQKVSELLEKLQLNSGGSTKILPGDDGTMLVLVTAHRRENFGEPFVNICAALKCLAETYGDRIRIVYPVHLNPNVQAPVYRLLSNIPNIILLPPLDYLPLVHLLKQTTLLLTDSGGLQEEAPGLGVPVLVLREVTERPEGVESGTVRLVGTSVEKMLGESRRLLDDRKAFDEMARAVNPYGDGHAAEYIVKALLNTMNKSYTR